MIEKFAITVRDARIGPSRDLTLEGMGESHTPQPRKLTISQGKTVLGITCISAGRDACAYLEQGGKASSEGTSMYSRNFS